MLELTDHIASERARIAELDAVLPALVADEQAEADAAFSRGRVRAPSSKPEPRCWPHAGAISKCATLASTSASSCWNGGSSRPSCRLEADAGARVEAESRRVSIEQSLVAVDRLTEIVSARREVIEVEHARLADQRRRQSEEVRSLASRLEGHRRERAESRASARTGPREGPPARHRGGGGEAPARDRDRDAAP